MKTPIHQKIRLIRKSKNLSQENMAFELNLSVGAYSNIERGAADISFKKLEKICEILEISIPELLQFKEEISESEIRRKDTIKFLETKISILESELKQYKKLQEIVLSK